MAKMSTQDRELLIRARDDGVLSIVTHRYREELPEGMAQIIRVNQLEKDGFLRMDRVTGDINNPAGERRYDYKLTPKGQREAK